MTTSLDFEPTIDPGSNEPIYRQLRQAIVQATESGVLRPDRPCLRHGRWPSHLASAAAR